MSDTEPLHNALVEIATDAGKKLIGPPAERIGYLISDVIGLAGGDYVRALQRRNSDGFERETQRIFHERHLEQSAIEPPLIIAGPIIAAAADESREELQKIWARLLVNAMDPQRTDRVRAEFVATIRKFEPIDAAVLEALRNPLVSNAENTAAHLSAKLSVRSGTVVVALASLEKHGCAWRQNNVGVKYQLLEYGRELLFAIDP